MSSKPQFLKLSLVLLTFLFGSQVFAQSDKKTTEVTIKPEKTFRLQMSISYFFRAETDHQYILQSNSIPLEENPYRHGVMLSTVGLLKLYKNLKLVLNLPIIDFYNVSSAPSDKSTINFFNKVSAGGIGLGYKWDVIHFFALFNFGQQIERMNAKAYASQQFPLSVFPTLTVNAVIPRDILKPYLETKTVNFPSVGISIDFGN